MPKFCEEIWFSYCKVREFFLLRSFPLYSMYTVPSHNPCIHILLPGMKMQISINKCAFRELYDETTQLLLSMFFLLKNNRFHIISSTVMIGYLIIIIILLLFSHSQNKSLNKGKAHYQMFHYTKTPEKP